MKREIFVIMACAFFSLMTGMVYGQSAQSIIEKVEANQTYQSISYEGTMEILSGSRTMTKTMKAWTVGSDKAFIEFTNPEDRGVRMLKLGKNLWMYFPSEKDTIKITGALLQQGMMGSNISYEDMMEPDILKSRYEASISGEETINDRPCVILTLKALSSAVAYSKRVIWVDKEH
ncbi:MAG: outer membrane lipoprotein-sorting protein, partial [Spirochaetia bacterium]|nr:outer membrane lipoprotein-sorting protein [Spirochaetia bacterium]